MFRDVAFGQYYPAKSFVHRMDPRVKILLNLLYMITIFLVQSYFGYALMLAYLLISIFASRIPLKSVLKSVKGIIFLALFTAIINLFFVKSGNMLVDWWIFRITDDGVNFAVKMVVRLVFIVTSASLLTLTTTPVDLTHGIESLLKPLTWIKVPVDEFALIMSITLRFIPTLMDETDRIIRAQKARGASFDTGGLIARAKAFVPILIPLLVNAFRRALLRGSTQTHQNEKIEIFLERPRGNRFYRAVYRRSHYVEVSPRRIVGVGKMDDLLTRRVKIGVQYIGTKYCGWQSQKNAVSVQELVEKALGGVLGHEVRLTASGRTDEGVHARRQVAHFDTDVEIKPFNLILGANVRLPDDIAVVDAEYTDNSFDARRDAKRKTYVYRMYVDSVRRPFLDVNHLQIYRQPDLSAMNKAAAGTTSNASARRAATQRPLSGKFFPVTCGRRGI